jgi:hypothetical protein
MHVYHRVKTIQPNIFAAVMTGYSDEMDLNTRHLLRRESRLVSLTKPVDTERLIDLLESIFAARSFGEH